MKFNRFLNPDIADEQKKWVAKLEIHYVNQCLYLPNDVILSLSRPGLNDYFFDQLKGLLSNGYLAFVFLEKKGIRKKTFLDAKHVVLTRPGITGSFSLEHKYLILSEGTQALKLFLEKSALEHILKPAQSAKTNKL